MENPLPEEPREEPQEKAQPESWEEPFDEGGAEPKSGSAKRHSSYTVMNGIQTVISIALVMATVLTLWNPRKVFNTPSLASLVEAGATQAALEAQAEVDNASVRHIGILVGHWQDSIPGEVCQDGTVESDVNLAIAERVKKKLEDLDYVVDLFPEYDLNLLNYEGAAFIALYSGSCAESPLPPSGFSIGGSYSAQNPELVDQLATCLAQEYQQSTQLPFTYEVINAEDASYHIFRDISVNIPAVRLVMGSLKTDRTLLVGEPDQVAEGIVAGIQCFLNAN
jgi:hypothetical protein